MPRYMGIHTFPKNAFTYDQVCQMADAAQHDANVKGYRSFINASQGKAVCIMDAADESAVRAWFKQMNMPTDAIVEVEIEGDGGRMNQLGQQKAALAGASA